MKDQPALGRSLAWACTLAALAVGGYHLAVECRVLTLREPMAIWESYYIALSRHWSFLYQKGHFIEALGLYGPAYPASVRPFLAAGLEPYFAHRLAALTALLGACAMLAVYLRKKGVRGSVVIGVVSIVYCLNAGTYSIMARPDFLLVAEVYAILFLGAWMAESGKPRTWQSILLGLLAFVGYLTKPYALLAWGSAAAYLALACGAWLPGMLSAVILALGVTAYGQTHFYFWLDTYKFLKSQTALQADAFRIQTVDFAVLACGLLAAALFARPFSRTGQGRPDYWLVATLIGGLPLLYLGFHAGAYLTYYLHLLLPPLSVLAALRIEEALASGRRPWLPVLLIANLVVLGIYAPPFPTTDPGWDALAHDVAQQKGPILGSWVIEPLGGTRSDLSLTSDGITPLALVFPNGLTGSDPALVEARKEIAGFHTWISSAITGPDHPAAIYLEGLTIRMPPADYIAVKQTYPDILMVPYDNPGMPDSVFVARENLGSIRKAMLTRYTPAAIFDVRPYYLESNSRREKAGTWHSAVLKLVPKP